MVFNTQHPGFIKFLENLIDNIITNIDIENYFTLNQERKLTIIYSVYKIVVKVINEKVKLDNNNTKSLLYSLLNKTLVLEKYELCAILKDIINNFDSISDTTKQDIKKTKRTVKIETND